MGESATRKLNIEQIGSSFSTVSFGASFPLPSFLIIHFTALLNRNRGVRCTVHLHLLALDYFDQCEQFNNALTQLFNNDMLTGLLDDPYHNIQ